MTRIKDFWEDFWNCFSRFSVPLSTLSILFLLISLTNFSVAPCFADSAVESLEVTTAADPTEAAQWKPTVVTGRRPKIGLALGGGGTRGGAHIGVLKVLDEAGIKFDMVTGTSIGGVFCAYYCAGVKPADLVKPWEKGDVMKHFMTIPLWLRIGAAPILYIPRLLGAHPYDGLYKGAEWRKYLAKHLPAGINNIEDLKLPFAAVSFNLVDGKPYMIRKGNLGKTMQATCAVPELRKPVEFDGQLLCDGGIICNLPVKQCRQMGADFVVAVNIDESFHKADLEYFTHPTSVAARLIRWGLYDLDRAQEQMADFTIHPNTDGVDLISTKKRDAIDTVVAGEEAARKCVDELKAKLNAYIAASSK